MDVASSPSLTNKDHEGAADRPLHKMREPRVAPSAL